MKETDDYRKLVQEIQDAHDHRRYAWWTQRREIENYIPPKLIESYFAIDLSGYYDTWKTIDIPKLLVEKVRSEIKDQREREKSIKAILNGKISKQITADMLKEIDAYEELEVFFKKVKAIVDGTYVEK